ncbi:MAG: energy-coupling factor ABC transporter ATP-binding protein [Kaiparowitsia implicata GSE-PSE-MK54-09C]|jgi:cobalt/nickel transport system ATP-binding protein|nr:energy-coupling factor ABC transporter ATP-binding protein [Kaiparowitsia implicata GSE-PSE-MK54-09C]
MACCNSALTVSNLCFGYPDQPDVLQSVNLEVKPGDRLGIIGNNGCGKTTLFLLLSGILTPDVGHIELMGQPVVPGQFRPEVGMVFQNPDDQLISASVWEDVAFGLENLGFTPEQIDRRVAEALTLTGTQDLAQRPPHHLSGGEKRMVAIAGVIAMRPQVVIYDEPSANLDLRARRRLICFLQQAPDTMVIASHDLEFVLEVCDRTVLMNDGTLIADAPPRDLLSNTALMQAHGLEVPYSLRTVSTSQSAL